MDAPPATPRQRLAAALADRYRLERELGQGGMATVYLAQDLKHDRRVAVKVLKPELAAVLGAERFVQEIRTTAALQHPHILPLFDSGTAGGFLYYVMPFIDGETLRSKLDRETQLGIDESVRTTASVADALDYAHRHGVIHRDIKPENILLHDGRPMVADFGIALAVSAAAGGRMTETGLSLGTPHYMSPEQATAEKEITARSDIYSLGSVLYEMLTGSPPHVGASAQQIIMKIVTEEAEPVTKLRKAVPPHVAAAVATALEKLPADRFATAREFAEALESPGYARTRVLAGVAPPAAGGRWRTAAIVCGTAAIALALLAAWIWRRPAPPPVVSRYGLAFPDSSVPQGMALSDDGRRLVFAVAGPNGEARLALKERNQDVATTIPGTERPQGFAVSPDGESVAFVQNASLRRVSLAGGSAVTLADSVLFAGIAWLDDNTIAYTTTGFELRRIPAGGGRASLLWNRAPPNRAPAMPFALPGSRGILFTLCNATCDGSDLWVYDLRADSARKLVPGVLRGYYLPGGQLAWVGHDGVMRAAPFDLGHLELRGNPVPLVNGIALLGGVVPNLVFSRSGTMIMQQATSVVRFGTRRLLWVDRAGRRTPVDSTWTFELSGSGNAGWSLSPDGSRLAIGLSTNSGDDIWVKRMPDGPASRLTFDTTSEVRPRWTPDGQSVVYVVNGQHVLRQRRADGTGETSTVLDAGRPVLEGQWSRDGRWLIARTGGENLRTGGRDIVGVEAGTGGKVRPLAADPAADESAAALSPDGRWLAYQSDETGRTEIYLRPFPGTGEGKWQVSLEGGHSPLWAHSGRELFFLDASRNMMSVPVAGVGAPELGQRRVLFPMGADLYSNDPEYYTPFDIAPDDQRFLMAEAQHDFLGAHPRYVLVENWPEEVRSVMAAGR